MGFGGNRSRLQITVQLDHSSLYGNFSGENIESFQMLSNPGCSLSVAVGGVTVSLLSILELGNSAFEVHRSWASR